MSVLLITAEDDIGGSSFRGHLHEFTNHFGGRVFVCPQVDAKRRCIDETLFEIGPQFLAVDPAIGNVEIAKMIDVDDVPI